ncbi:MAG: hypothetical protein MK082_03055 [Phycisphaerales bacterium]|nr:hypothetical protein [Phycisphaerales bacterium]
MEQKTSTRYRYRSEGRTSPWMSGSELQAAARDGVFTDDAQVQMAGHAEWMTARDVKGLSFTPVAEETEPATEEEDRLTRFNTIREVIGSFTRQDVEIDLKERGTHVTVNLCATSTDHFEILDDDAVERTFIPFHQVRSLVAIDNGKGGSIYRENHLLRINLV